MAELKTKATNASVKDYIASRASEEQRVDCKALMSMFSSITRQRPKMWGPSMVGYGSFRYNYASGHSGESPLAAFAIRGRDLVVYLAPVQAGRKALLSKLGPHKMTKSCLYFKRLADLDTSVLQKLVVGSIADARQRYEK
jgi:hypothetical protein